MTVIAGCIADNSVYIGGDRRLSEEAGSHIFTTMIPKVFKLPGVPVLAGLAGESSVTNLICYRLRDLAVDDCADPNEYIVDVAHDLLDALIEIGATDLDATLLMGYKARLYIADLPSAMVTALGEKAYAIGTAAPYAIGALRALSFGNIIRDPGQLLMHTLQIATEYCRDAGGGFDILKMSQSGDLEKVA